MNNLPKYYTTAKSSNVLTTMNNKAFIIQYVNEKSMKIKNAIIDDISNIQNQDIKIKMEFILNVAIMVKKSKLDKKLDMNALYVKNIVSIIKRFDKLDRKIVNKVIKGLKDITPTMTKKYNDDVMKLITKLIKDNQVTTNDDTTTTTTANDDTTTTTTANDTTTTTANDETTNDVNYDDVEKIALQLNDDEKLKLIATLQDSLKLVA